MQDLTKGMTSLHIRNGRVVDPGSGFDAPADVFVADGKIAAIGAAPAGFIADGTLDASGLIVCPGLVDSSARLGGVESELAAAVAGGVTSVACPPDTNPPLDEPGLVERLVRRSEAVGLARVYPLGALTQKLAGEKVAEMNSLMRAGCVALSQAQHPVPDTQVLLRAMQYAATFGYAIHLQPEDHYLARDGVAHDGEVAARLGLAGIPVCAETIAIASAIELAKIAGVRLHLARLSSAAGAALVAAARGAGLAVSADVSIHHLHLADHDIGFFDSMARFDPPLRSPADRDALRRAAADGVVSICSDHTPVDEDGKQLPFAEAVPGASSLELLLPLTLRWANELGLSLTTALARVTCDPARVLQIARGSLAVGADADLCVFDPSEHWQVTPASLVSQGKNSPFVGQELAGRVKATLVGGRVVFSR